LSDCGSLFPHLNVRLLNLGILPFGLDDLGLYLFLTTYVVLNLMKEFLKTQHRVKLAYTADHNADNGVGKEDE
jgi:DNA-directed RNA polymerase subunit L